MRAEEILKMTGTLEEDDRLSFLPQDMQIKTTLDIYLAIKSKCGALIAGEFSRMMLSFDNSSPNIPKNPRPLYEFLAKQNDYISLACANRLENFL